jgi:hypothetical protein
LHCTRTTLHVKQHHHSIIHFKHLSHAQEVLRRMEPTDHLEDMKAALLMTAGDIVTCL